MSLRLACRTVPVHAQAVTANPAETRGTHFGGGSCEPKPKSNDPPNLKQGTNRMFVSLPDGKASKPSSRSIRMRRTDLHLTGRMSQEALLLLSLAPVGHDHAVSSNRRQIVSPLAE